MAGIPKVSDQLNPLLLRNAFYFNLANPTAKTRFDSNTVLYEQVIDISTHLLNAIGCKYLTRISLFWKASELQCSSPLLLLFMPLNRFFSRDRDSERHLMSINSSNTQ